MHFVCVWKYLYTQSFWNKASYWVVTFPLCLIDHKLVSRSGKPPLKSPNLGAPLVAQRLKHLPPMRQTWIRSLGREDPLEKEMATHSSILTGESHGWRSLVDYSPWGRKESDRTERLHLTSPHLNLGAHRPNLTPRWFYLIMYFKASYADALRKVMYLSVPDWSLKAFEFAPSVLWHHWKWLVFYFTSISYYSGHSEANSSLASSKTACTLPGNHQ